MTTTGELQPGWPKGGGPGRLMVVAAWFNLQLHDTILLFWFNLQLHDTIVLFIISGPLNIQLYLGHSHFKRHTFLSAATCNVVWQA